MYNVQLRPLRPPGGVGGLAAVTSVACVPGEEPAVATYFPAYDANGNIVQYFNEAGEAVAGFEYDAFGNTVATSGSQADAFAHRFSTKCFDAETGLYCYGYRFYSPELGRWVSRDPIGEEGGLNEVAFLENSSVNVYDLMGLFGSSIHLRATSDWAMELGVDKKVASIIGREDDGVDTQYSAYPPFTERNWGWHFNRALGVDSRLAHASEMFTKAKRYCTGGQDDAESAAKNLGIGLHPLQDWVAHGDFNSMNDMPNITQIKSKIKALKYAHNYYGHTRFARREIEDAISHVDDEALDANGPGGRATRSVLVERSRASGNIFFATDFHNGNERLTLTRDKTKEYLAEFILYVKRNGKPCGECQKKFLKQSNP